MTVIFSEVEPVFHKKDVPGIFEFTFRVAEAPLQIILPDEAMDREGKGRITTDVWAVPTHPAGELTVNMYMVLDPGLTVVVGVLLPLLQLNKDPGTLLLAVSVDDSPRQITGDELVIFTAGIGFTTIWIEVDEVQPLALVPVTKYVVDVLGLTVTEFPVDPLLHSKAVPGKLLLTFILADAPSQMDVVLALMFSTGKGKTFTVVCADEVQPAGLLTVIE